MNHLNKHEPTNSAKAEILQKNKVNTDIKKTFATSRRKQSAPRADTISIRERQKMHNAISNQLLMEERNTQ